MQDLDSEPGMGMDLDSAVGVPDDMEEEEYIWLGQGSAGKGDMEVTKNLMMLKRVFGRDRW
jgi:hypothetical protein